MKILFIFLIVVVSSIVCASPLQDAIAIRLTIKKCLGSEIVFLCKKPKGVQLCHLNLETGEYRLNILDLDADNSLKGISLSDLDNKKILYSESLDKSGEFKSTSNDTPDGKYFSTGEYLDVMTRFSGDVKNSLIFSGESLPINLLKSIEHEHDKMADTIAQFGLLLKKSDAGDSFDIFQVLETSSASELGFKEGDLVIGVKTPGKESSLKNVMNFRFDKRSDEIIFEISREGRREDLRFFKPSIMEVRLNSYEEYLNLADPEQTTEGD